MNAAPLIPFPPLAFAMAVIVLGTAIGLLAVAGVWLYRKWRTWRADRALLDHIRARRAFRAASRFGLLTKDFR